MPLAAARWWLVFGMFFSSLASGQPPGGPVQIGGDRVFRWNLDGQDATYLVGHATLAQDRRVWSADELLVVTHRSDAGVTVRVVAKGLEEPAAAADPPGDPPAYRETTENDAAAGPRGWTMSSWDHPTVDAREFLGPPRGEVSLVKHLPALAITTPAGRATSLETGKSLDQLSTKLSGQSPQEFDSQFDSQFHEQSSEPSTEQVVRLVQFEQPGIDTNLSAPPSGPTGQPPSTLPPSTLPPSTLPLSQSFPAPPPPTTIDTSIDGQATAGESIFVVGGGTKSFSLSGRGATSPPDIRSIQRRETGEDVLIARGGVTITVRDLQINLPGVGLNDLGTVSISADRVVAWVPPLKNLLTDPSAFSTADGELYLEGDVVFRVGERIIYAESMYYNVTRETGMVLDAEAITTIPEYQGVVRLKSEVLQQLSQGNFLAFDAAVTTSRLGVPRYWLQSERLQFTNRVTRTTNRVTGQPELVSEPFIESSNNFVYAGGLPVFYWPTLAAPLREPTLYISGIDFGNDDIFGVRALVDFNLFQVLGINDAPRGVDWDLTLGVLSDRGPVIGTSLDYTVAGLFGVPGPVQGNFDTWLIDDDGLDTLGQTRQDVEPEQSFRGRSLLRHRHRLPADYEFIGEIGWISDRNFLEQYFENEFDNGVDHRTAVRLQRFFGANHFDLSTQVQVNDFFTETEELPDLEHHLLGGSFLDIFTVSMHNRIGFHRLNPAEAPDDPSIIGAPGFVLPPGVVEASGVVASSKREYALPINLGPLKIVPHADGEVTYFGEAVDGEDLTRLVGGGGIRFNLPMWRFDPGVRSELLNIDGLAHKVNWHGEYLYQSSNTNLDEVPLFDELDDTAQEEFRRRFTFDTFGGLLPEEFDRRRFAFRQGIQGRVASPSDSVADDLEQVRLGVRQTFETKRGLPGRQRIVDVFRFDVETILFPNQDRDNFGETVGPTTYDAQYFLGDRVSILSDGYFDFFDDGLRSISAGVQTSRPGLGDVYIGILSLEGPISSTVLRANLNYRLNEKWIASGSTIYDFGDAGNVGQSLGLTRIGESFLVRLGINVDEGRDNVGFAFAVEPRFLPRANLGRLGGQFIAPPGAEGLE